MLEIWSRGGKEGRREGRREGGEDLREGGLYNNVSIASSWELITQSQLKEKGCLKCTILDSPNIWGTSIFSAVDIIMTRQIKVLSPNRQLRYMTCIFSQVPNNFLEVVAATLLWVYSTFTMRFFQCVRHFNKISLSRLSFISIVEDEPI